ncbi:MAG: flagellar brake protein, partial [Spirochaetia bacterium]
PKYRLGLRSSRNISQGQIMKLTVPGTSGAFTCKVVENMRKYLAVSYPEGPKLPPGYSWQGQRVNIYFWRKEDAGYYFESRVIGDYLERKYPILHIAHADKIVRTQKRSSVRAELKTKGTLFPLRSIQQANETIENSGGYRCRMVDISEDGAAIMVGGKAKPGLPVKLQTQINGKNIVLSGTVKGVTYRSKPHVSILHIEAQEPSKVIRNTILTYVYNIFRDETGDSPKAVRKGSAAPRAGGTTKASGNGEAYAASGTTQGEADSQEADA